MTAIEESERRSKKSCDALLTGRIQLLWITTRTHCRSERQATIFTVAKAALSAIPFVGGPAAELFALVLAPPLEKRRDV